MNQLAKWKSISYLIAIFLVGAITGAVVDWRVTRYWKKLPLSAGKIADHIRTKYKSRLHPSTEQADGMEPFIRQAATDIEVVNHATGEKITLIMSNADAQIALVLSPEQQRKLQEVERDRREYFRNRFPAPDESPEQHHVE